MAEITLRLLVVVVVVVMVLELNLPSSQPSGRAILEQCHDRPRHSLA